MVALASGAVGVEALGSNYLEISQSTTGVIVTATLPILGLLEWVCCRLYGLGGEEVPPASPEIPQRR